jgi:hypothetical protein
MRLFAAIALLALGLSAPALAETNVGVTAAVNQDATGSVGSNVKTISLGDSVVFNQRIQTGGSGLVQVLLADGTTFMVGPNSDLVIDKFVYDPNAGTAQVTASFTKGVLRFIGGQTSKTEGGVTINTPVGTMGIRGAMVDVVLNPPAGTPPHVDMLFGNEVTLERGQELLGRLYATGYSLALGDDGAFKVLKTPPNWGSQIQAALAGAAGTKGGAPKGPTDGDVKNSQVANNNSGKGPNKDGLSKEELDALFYAAAHYDELRPFLNQPTIMKGFSSAMPHAESGGEGGSIPLVGAYDSETGLAINAEVAFGPNGDPIGIAMVLTSPACLNCQGFVYDSTTGQLDVRFGNDVLPLIVESASIREADATDREDLELTCDCGFIRWGYWNVSASGQLGNDSVSLEVDKGTWVTGDLTTSAQLNDLIVPTADWDTTHATYSGDMVGKLDGEGGVIDATGSFDMDWNFGHRAGSIEGEFAGEYFSTGLISDGEGGPATNFNSDGNTYNTVFEGAFVNNGTEAAGGVIGNFAMEQSGGLASGIFMGSRGSNEPGLGFNTD